MPPQIRHFLEFFYKKYHKYVTEEAIIIKFLALNAKKRIENQKWASTSLIRTKLKFIEFPNQFITWQNGRVLPSFHSLQPLLTQRFDKVVLYITFLLVFLPIVSRRKLRS